MSSRRQFLAAAGAALALTAIRAQAASSKETVAFIGTGKVASIVGKSLANQGYTLIFGSRTPDSDKVKALLADVGHGATAAAPKNAVAKAQMVVLAVPGGVAVETAGSIGDLNGKLVLDVTNNIKIENNYVAPIDGPSTAEQIQTMFPKAKVVKGLNTLNVMVMANPKMGGDHVTCPVAGNDKEAKEKVIGIIQGMGLEALDVGPIVGARYIENMERMNIGFRLYAPGLDTDFNIHVRGTRREKL